MQQKIQAVEPDWIEGYPGGIRLRFCQGGDRSPQGIRNRHIQIHVRGVPIFNDGLKCGRIEIGVLVELAFVVPIHEMIAEDGGAEDEEWDEDQEKDRDGRLTRREWAGERIEWLGHGEWRNHCIGQRMPGKGEGFVRVVKKVTDTYPRYLSANAEISVGVGR